MRGVAFNAKMKLHKVRKLILMHEYNGNIPEGDGGKVFYPR